MSVPSASQTVGPFFPAHFFGPGDHDLTFTADPAKRARGASITISGRVFEAGRVPRWNTILELWQADASGRFAHPHDPRALEADPNFMKWGRRWTDSAGHFEFVSVRPGGYLDPLTGRPRAPHINVSIMGSGLMRRLLTTWFFAGDPANDTDPVLQALPEARLRERLMLRPSGASAFAIDIVLQGEDATPFWED